MSFTVQTAELLKRYAWKQGVAGSIPGYARKQGVAGSIPGGGTYFHFALTYSQLGEDHTNEIKHHIHPE